MFKKLGLGEAKATNVSLQLADRFIKHLRGIIEEILVKVDKFVFLLILLCWIYRKIKKFPLFLVNRFWLLGG